MKKALATIGLFLFLLTGAFCLLAFVMLSLGSNSLDYRPDSAMRAAYFYRVILLISVLGFVGSVVALIKGRNKPR